MTGTDKQIAWATDLLTRYTAAREVIMTKVANAPEANRPVLLSAIAKIDAKLNDQAHAGDIIARIGYAYFNDTDHAHHVKALQEAIGSICNGHDTVLTCA